MITGKVGKFGFTLRKETLQEEAFMLFTFLAQIGESLFCKISENAKFVQVYFIR